MHYTPADHANANDDACRTAREAGATKCSTRYIHPAYWSELDRLALHRGRWGQETTNSTHSTSTIAFGPRV